MGLSRGAAPDPEATGDNVWQLSDGKEEEEQEEEEEERRDQATQSADP